VAENVADIGDAETRPPSEGEGSQTEGAGVVRDIEGPPREVPLWAAVKADHDTGNYTQQQLCDMHGVTRSALNWRIKRDTWTRRYSTKSVNRKQIIARMFRVLELQVKSLETEMNEMERGARRSGDREVSLLGKLAGNLDKLIALKATPGNKADNRKGTKHMEDMRNKLVERIEQLKRS
jgi:hypothetical protein